mmetsp:Transcript_10692/g.32358  ORF Transcript_10692/g.32358 Transcript_10692/m.32358 type:complete len:220 (-) Transcript_10692:55-714(-)
MTTAHRPTLPGMAAREHGNEFGVYGTGGVRSMQMPARDLPSQTKMKYRAGHQLEGILDDRAAVIEKTDALERKADAPLLTAEPHVAPDKDRLATSEAFAPGDLDAYDDDDDDRGGSDDSDDDSDDEELALQLELEKIKREREDERLRKEAEARRERDDAALTTNPLLNDNPSGAVKRKWNDDVVFRHQARGAPEKKGKTFINDTIRNDFHKRFLAKYIQ